MKDLYSAKKLASRMYPKSGEAIDCDVLTEAMQLHLEQIEKDVKGLDDMFGIPKAGRRQKGLPGRKENLTPEVSGLAS